VLGNFSSGPSDAAETTAANRATEQIRSGRSTGNELQSLRTEVSDLKKQNDELKKNFEELKKEVKARSSIGTNAPTEPKKTNTSTRKRR